MQTLTIVLLVGAVFALAGTIYAAYKYNQNYKNSVANPRFKSFYGAGGSQPVLSCPDGYKISFVGSQDKSYYLADYSPATNCVPIDITSDIQAQADGKSNVTLTTIPLGQVYNAQLSLACTPAPGTTFAYGQYECVPA